MRLLNSALIVFFFISYPKAISLYSFENLNIENNRTLTKSISNLKIIEPYCGEWVANWNFPISRIDVKSALHDILSDLNSLNKREESSSSIFLKALIWHYIYQFRVDSAFEKSEEYSKILIDKFPERVEGRWLRGVNLIYAAKLIDGFAVLDSLRLNSSELPDEFYQDMSKLSSQSFLPNVSDNTSTDLYSSMGFNLKSVEFEPEESMPLTKKWQVISEQDSSRLTGFLFGMKFNLKKPYPLIFPKLYPAKSFVLNMDPDSSIINETPTDLIFEINQPPVKMELKIFVNISSIKMSQEEYLYNLVSGKYDRIIPLDTPKKQNSIAVKCYEYSVVKGLYNMYTVYAVLDRYVNRGQLGFYKSTTDKKTNLIKIRYLVALRSPVEVENKADVLFVNTLNNFSKIYPR